MSDAPPLIPDPEPTGLSGGSGGEDIQRRGIAGAGVQTIQRRRPSGLVPQRGRRPMKEYPLSDSDLHDLRNMGIGAVLCFSIGSVCLGIWSNIFTSMGFASDVPKELLSIWTAREFDVLIAALISYFIGLVLVGMGYSRIDQIKSEVDFGEGNNSRRRRWPWVICGIAIAAALIYGGYWLGTHGY